MRASSARGAKRSSLNRADYEALASFRFAVRRYLAFTEAGARSVGLTTQQHQALLAIKAHSFSRPMSVGDLAGELLLDLRAARVGLDEARELAESDDASVRDVADVGLAVERHEVVLADAVEGDVAQDHHLLVADVELHLEQALGIDAESLEEFAVHAGDARRRLGEALAVGVFADGEDHLAEGALDARFIDGLAGCQRVREAVDGHVRSRHRAPA